VEAISLQYEIALKYYKEMIFTFQINTFSITTIVSNVRTIKLNLKNMKCVGELSKPNNRMKCGAIYYISKLNMHNEFIQKNLNKQLKLLLYKLVNITAEILGTLGAHFFYK
jgi:hypothetical protein